MARLFNALVLFGATTSLSNCGGKATEASGETGVGGTAAGGAPSVPNIGGSVNDTSSGGRGVALPLGSGGGDPTGGARTGSGSSSGSSPSLPPAGTVAQWNCSAQLSECSGGNFSASNYSLTKACPVELARPKSRADCKSNEWFECISAHSAAGTDIAVNCECTPYDENACHCVDPAGNLRPAQCTDHEKLCLCAYPGILR